MPLLEKNRVLIVWQPLWRYYVYSAEQNEHGQGFFGIDVFMVLKTLS